MHDDKIMNMFKRGWSENSIRGNHIEVNINSYSNSYHLVIIIILNTHQWSGVYFKTHLFVRIIMAYLKWKSIHTIHMYRVR